MRKFLAALTAAFYLYGFTFCLCYAAATGQVHAEEQDEHEQGACRHPTQTSDQDQPHHGHGSQGSCCVKFLQGAPGLLPETFSKPLPSLGISLHFQSLAATCTDPWQHACFYRSHAPPELPPQDPLASLASPRAPPFSA